MRLICLAVLLIAARAAAAAPACLDTTALDPRVRVTEEGETLIIQVGDARVTIATPPCEVMTEVVAAEARTLLPDEVDVVRLEAEATHAVGHPVSLHARGGAGWVVRVTFATCRREILAGALPRGHDGQVRRIVAVARAVEGCDETARVVAERADLLLKKIRTDVDASETAPYVLVAGSIAGGSLIALRWQLEDDLGPADGFYGAGAAIWLVGGLAATATEDDTVAQATFMTGSGIAIAGLAFEDDRVHAAPIVAGAAHVAVAGMIVAERMRRPATSRARLREIRAILASPAARAGLGTGELLALEREWRASYLPGSALRWATPFLLGAAISLGMAAFHDESEMSLDLLVGGALLAEAGLVLFHRRGTRPYDRDVARYDLVIGAGTVGVGGTF